MLDYYFWLQYIDIAAYSLSCTAKRRNRSSPRADDFERRCCKPTGPQVGGLFDSRRPAMAQKATHRQTSSSSAAAPVVLFGVDENGKPKAARFPENQANLATKAAGHLKLHVLPIIGPVVVDLAGRLPAGRIHANGRGFVPYIRRDLYAKLLAAAGSPQGGQTSAAASTHAKSGSQNGQG